MEEWEVIWIMSAHEGKEEERRHDTTMWEKLREAGIVGVIGAMGIDAMCSFLAVVLVFVCVRVGILALLSP